MIRFKGRGRKLEPFRLLQEFSVRQKVKIPRYARDDTTFVIPSAARDPSSDYLSFVTVWKDLEITCQRPSALSRVR